ncbi:TPA: low molecular weight phosphotyrosine protein phosphatase, partial [Listeria monocytogenes]|nr:low molecular weight phosphotyrosine protein phosphatase [Listeria monocytogenes]HDU1171498.1 low molecular weight phosphotyrosine protein phosphatase [Listeria monocytogenes]
ETERMVTEGVKALLAYITKK